MARTLPGLSGSEMQRSLCMGGEPLVAPLDLVWSLPKPKGMHACLATGYKTTMSWPGRCFSRIDLFPCFCATVRTQPKKEENPQKKWPSNLTFVCISTAADGNILNLQLYPIYAVVVLALFGRTSIVAHLSDFYAPPKFSQKKLTSRSSSCSLALATCNFFTAKYARTRQMQLYNVLYTYRVS